MMLLIVLVITIALFFINLISEKKNLSQTLGGSFYLKDHTGGFLNSKKLNKKKVNLFWLYILSGYMSNGYA